MKNKKKLVSLITAFLVAVAMLVPATVSAEETTTWKAPTEPVRVNDKIVKVGMHAAANTTALYLGANLVAERASDYRSITSATTPEAKYEAAKAFTKLGVFGTALNSNPDPYLLNYLYNRGVDAGEVSGNKVDDEVYLSSVGSPMASDTTIVPSLGTSYTLARRPDITMDTAGGYDSLIAQLPENTNDYDFDSYDPIQLTYEANNLNSFVNDMYRLSEAMLKTGKKGRYDKDDYNSFDIAQTYEKFLKGLQLYVISEQAKGTIPKRTVAIVDPESGEDTNGDYVPDRYKVYTSNQSIGTAASVRAAEYSENTTNNIIDTENISPTDDTYYATVDQLCKADVILASAGQTTQESEQAFVDNLVAAGATSIPKIYMNDPAGMFGIRMNSCENIMGIAYYQGFIYPEVLNPIHAAMYGYQNFWHVAQDSDLVSLANANFEEASTPANATPDGYTKDGIDKEIDQGLEYYANHESQFKGTKLELTDNIDVSGFVKKNVSAASVSRIGTKIYNGKAIKPAVTVKYGSKTLANGTDYVIAYTNNVKPGKATVKISGIGSYTGSKTITFNIAPKKGLIKKLRNVRTRGIKVTYRKDTLASGMQIKLGTNKSMTKNRKYVTVSAKKYTKTIKKLKKKTYYVKIRSYKKIGGKKVYGPYSSVKKVRVRR
ncbi:MAG: hypothetical protein ACOX4I_02100 [Anaerovoracaceae bacterium]